MAETERREVPVLAEFGQLTWRHSWRCGWEWKHRQPYTARGLIARDIPDIGLVIVVNPWYLGTSGALYWWGADAEALLAAPGTEWQPTATAEVVVTLWTRGRERRFETAFGLAGGGARLADRGRGVIDTMPLPVPAEVAPEPGDAEWVVADVRVPPYRQIWL